MVTVASDVLAEEYDAWLDRLGAIDWQASDPAAVARMAPQLLRGADRMHAISLLAAAQHELNGGIGRDGDGSAGDWHSRQTKSSKDSGRRRAARAKRMSKAKTSKAAAEGKLSTEQAEKLAAARNEENADLFDQVEDELIEKAKGSYDDAVRTADDFRSSTGETPEQRAARLWRRRTASMWDDDEGTVQARASLAGDQGAETKAIFDEFVRREFADRTGEDRRSNAQVRADAFHALGRSAKRGLLDQHPAAAERVTVQVQVRYEDLIDDQIAEWAGVDIRTGLELSGHAIRRLCCEAGIIRMVTIGDSQVIDVGRKTPTIPSATRKAALARDGGCTFPGCHHRDGVQVHHLKFWSRNGNTDLANLLCICWKHHRLVHEGGWTLELDLATRRGIWIAPDGRRLIGQRRAPAGASSTAAA
jgi:Domain of unknown function (DUF222)